MGNIFGSSTNEDQTIHLSESCVERLRSKENKPKPPEPKSTVIKELNPSEKKEMLKLQRLDEKHSENYGLTVKCFNFLVEEIECEMGPNITKICSEEDVIRCLKKNPQCAIKCHQIMSDYIDCIDTARIEKLIERIRQDRKSRKKYLKNRLAGY